MENTKTPILSPTMKERSYSSDPDCEPFVEINYTRRGSDDSQEPPNNVKHDINKSANKSSHNSSIAITNSATGEKNPNSQTVNTETSSESLKELENKLNTDGDQEVKSELRIAEDEGSGDAASRHDKRSESLIEVSSSYIKGLEFSITLCCVLEFLSI